MIVFKLPDERITFDSKLFFWGELPKSGASAG